MANDGTVKIGAEVDEKEFAESLSKLSKSAKTAYANVTIGVEVDKKELDTALSEVGKGAKQIKPVELPIKPDTDDFKKQLGDLEKETSKNVSALKDLNRALDLSPKSTDLLIEKQRLLQSAVEAAAKKADALNLALGKAKDSGEAEKNADAYRKLVIAFSNAEAEAKNMQTELDDVSDKLKNGSEATADLDDATDKLGRSYTSVGDIIKGVAIGNLISNGVQAAISGIKNLVRELWGLDEATLEFREAQGKLNTAFEAAGMSTETAKQAYSDFYKILGDTDTATEASQLLAKLTNGEEDLSKWTNIAAGVYGTFGDALPIEGLIEAANETAKTGKVTGVLADALNWAGISEDEFNEGLETLGNESLRNYRIMRTLAGVYDEAADAFYSNNEAVIEARENQIELDDAMAKVGETISNIKNAFLDELSPVVSNVAEKFSGLASAVDWEALAARIGSFVEKIDFDRVFGAIQDAISNINFDVLFDTVGNVVESMISFAQAIAPVVSIVAQLASQLFQFFEQMNPQIKMFLVGFLTAAAAVMKLGGAISDVGGAVSGVGKIASLFSAGPGNQLYATFLKWSVIILAIITSLTLLIAMINTLMGKGDAMNSTLNSMGNAMNGMGGGSSGAFGGSGGRGGGSAGMARSAPAAESEPAAFSLAAEDGAAMSRASMLRSLESALPEAAGRMSIATASMTPAAAYSAPPPVNSGGNAGNGQPVQIIDRRPIVIKAEGDLAPLARLFKPALDAENIRVGSGV